MKEQEKTVQTTWKIAFSSALPLLIFTLVAVAIISIISYQRVKEIGGSAEILDAAFGVCSGIPMEQASFYSEEPGIHPVAAFIEKDGFLQGASNYLQPEWVPQNASQLELVMCANQPRPAFRALCSDRNKINQIGGEIPFELRSAKTAGIITAGVIVSDDNARVECLSELPQSPNMDSSVPDEMIIRFLERFVIK
ncbi:MAG: hypothetical protein ACI85U_001382 [Candidatus Promineifilaceae bacterium]|jgi:hypothetical protein